MTGSFSSVPPPKASTPPPGAAASGPAADPLASVGVPQGPLRATGSRRPRTLIAAVGAVVALAAAAYVAFGSSSNGVVDPVAAAAIRSSQAPGYRETMAMTMTSTGGMQVTANGTASVDPSTHLAQINMAMDFPNSAQLVQALGSDRLRFTEVVDGTTVYMKLPSAVMGQLSSVGKSWISVNLAKLANVPGASSLLDSPSSDPGEMLEYLRAASDSVVAEGRQMVDGVQTTKYQATVDLNRVADSVPSSDQPAAHAAISEMEQEGAPTSYPVDVWVDANKLVRKFEMSLNTTTSGQSVDIGIVANIVNYGPQTQLAPPPSSDVASVS
jgi:hypothetical protein